MTRTIDDNTLIQAFQQGDAWAEKIIFDRYFVPLTLYAERITQSVDAAQDIAMEAITKSLYRRGDFAAITKLKSFLYQVVHNASINLTIANDRHRRAHAEIAKDTVEETEGSAPWLIEIRRAELLREIYREVDNLPGKCGQIFKMLFIEKLTTDVIAERMGINVHTVRTQKARAISLIRTALLKKGKLTTLLFFYGWLHLHS